MSKLRTAIEAAKRQRRAAELAQPSARITTPSATHAAGIAAPPTPAGSRQLSMSTLPRVSVSQAALKANRVLSNETPHRAEGAYRMLRTRIMQKMRSNSWRILGVSSIGPNEGKTLTAINLAISIAAEVDQEALLVDLDLRRPSVGNCLGIGEADFKSLSDYFGGGLQDIGDLLVCPDIDRLGCLLSAVPLERPSDVLASPLGKRLFQELRTRLLSETIVIVDLPPLVTVDDALAVAPMIDALLFVVAEGQTKRDELTDARELLENFNLIGTILNKSVENDDKRHKYYY